MTVAVLHPRAAGDRQEWNVLAGAATQWQALLTNDGDTSVSGVQWPSDNVVSLFLVDHLPSGVGVINNVQINMVARRTNNNLALVNLHYKLPGVVESSTANVFFSNVVYVGFSASFVPSVVQAAGMQVGALLGSNFWGTWVTYLDATLTYNEGPPTPVTDPATAITFISATLNGTLLNDGVSGFPCPCGFQWGLTVAYGNTTPTQNRLMGQTFAQPITSLTPGATYHFRAFATNAYGTTYGDDATFIAVPGFSGADLAFRTLDQIVIPEAPGNRLQLLEDTTLTHLLRRL